jgi:hypothetical protein
MGVATGATTLLVQAIASRHGFAASSFSAVGSLDYHSPAARKFPFDGSIFPYGAIHFSTLPHWQYYLQPIAQWRPWLERDLRQMKDLGLNTPRHRSAAFSDLLADENLPVKQESGAVTLETSLDPKAVKAWSVQTTGV